MLRATESQLPAATTARDGQPKLQDKQSERDHREIPIDKVGVRGLRFPIQVRDKARASQNTIATIGMYVDLPKEFKGTHMSRFIEVLNAHGNIVHVNNIPDILAAMREKLKSETAHLEKYLGEAGKSRFSFEGLEHIEAARDSGRPILIVSGHFGNFELAFVVLHHVGVRCAAITRRPNNAYVADWFANKRAHLGFDQQIPKGPEGTRRMVSMLRHGGHVGMLADQRLSEGIPVPLFGHDAMTVHTPATLALSHGVIVLPIAVRREPDARFRAVFHPPIEPPGLGSEARDIIAMTTALNAFVETEVRARPTDWLWMHKRWEPAETLSRRAAKLLEAARDTAVREN